MRDTPGYLMPGRGLLRAQHLAGVFQHQHESGRGGRPLCQRGYRDRQVEHLPRRLQIDLAGRHAGALRPLHEVLNLHHVFARKEILEAGSLGQLLRAEEAMQCAIHALNPAVGTQRNHTGGNAFEDRFGETAAAFQLAAVGLQLLRHFIEGAHQRGELIHGLHLHAIPQVALAHFSRGFEQRGDGLSDLPRKQQRDPGGHEQDEQRDYQQEQHVQTADGISLGCELIVFPNVFLNLRLLLRQIHTGAHPQHQRVRLNRLSGIDSRCAIGSGRAIAKYRARREQLAAVFFVLAQLPGVAVRGLHPQIGDTILRAHSREIGSTRAHLRHRGDPVHQRLGAALHFVAERDARVDQIDTHAFRRAAEPLVHRAIQNRVAEHHQKHHRQQAQRQRAQHQPRLYMRPFAIGLAIDVQLHAGAEQHESQRHRQDDDQRGDGPQSEGLRGVRWTVFAEVERNLPHHQRQQDGEQNQAGAVQVPLAHGSTQL